MIRYEFSHGARFLWEALEYKVREINGLDITIENVMYGGIRTVNVEQLAGAWETGNLVFAKDDSNPTITTIDLDEYSEEERQEMERRFRIIEPYIKGKISESTVESYIQTLPEKRPSRPTFFRWVKLYSKYQDVRYLVGQKAGPRTRRVDSKIIGKLLELMEGKLYEGTEVAIAVIYRNLKLYVKEANQYLEEGEEPIGMPSRRTVYRMAQEMVDQYKRDVAKHGRVQADLNKHGATSIVMVQRPLERVEVDWTEADLFIVDTGTFKVHRFYLILAVDKLTTNVLGFHVTFREPSALDLKECLLHAMLPKTYVKSLYPMVRNEWIAWGKPEEVVWDNAKVNESRDLEDALRLVGIDCQYCNVKSGYQKGTVEKTLGDVMRILHRYHGTTHSNPQERDQYKSEEKASITVIELYEMLHVILVDILGNSIHHDFGLTPHHMWERAMSSTRVHRTLSRTPKDLKIIFGAGLANRTITNKGVEINRHFYQSDELMDLKRRKERDGDDSPVRVRFRHGDMRVVYVYDAENNEYVDAYSSFNSLERKGFDERYPVHYQQLADYSRQIGINIENFDDTQVAEYERTLDQIAAKGKRNLYRIKRGSLEISEDMIMHHTSLVNHQLDALEGVNVEPIPALETVHNIREVDTAKSRTANAKKREATGFTKMKPPGVPDSQSPSNRKEYDAESTSWGVVHVKK